MRKYIPLFLFLVPMLMAAKCPKKDSPPILTMICTLDGAGGGDCVDTDENKIYKSPSEMKNMFAIPQVDARNLISWCYGVSPKTAQREIDKLTTEISDSTSSDRSLGEN